MATGGKSVDSGRKIVCNICEKGDLSVTADYFCVSCEQYLCLGCKQYHSRVKATESHQVLGTNEIQTLSSLTLGSEAMETPICAEHERKFEYFCVKHMTILCQTCKLIQHKTCTNITELQKAANDVFSEGHSKNILKGMDKLLDGFIKYKDKIENNKDELYKSKQSEINKVQHTIMTAKSHLDKLGAAACDEINSAFAGELKRVDDKIHVSDVTISQIKKRKAKLERAMEVGDKESELVTVNNITKEIKHHFSLLKDIVEDTNDIDIEFKASDTFDKMTQIIPNLGTVSVTESPSQPDTETVAIYTGELKPRTATDTRDPGIMSYEVLPDGRHLIVDSQNNKLKLYDSNNQYVSEIVLPDIPLSVVILRDNEVMLSLLDIASLQYINIGTDLSLSQTKKVNYQPLAMVKYGDDILATIDDGLYKVVVIDNHGTVKRKIYQDNGSIFSRPSFIGLSIEQKIVYVVDEDKGCIGLTMEGNIVFQYQKVKYYTGLAVGRDSVFIGVTLGKGYSVRRLSLRGDFMEDMDLGISWPLKIADNRLIIFNEDDQGERLIKFYQLLEVNMS